MSLSLSAMRTLTKHSRSLSLSRTLTAPISVRAFHSPFVTLTESSSPLTTPPAPSSSYEKQIEHVNEPQQSVNGTHTYVVSQPDPSHTPYQVPSGAYPTSAPYQSFTATSKDSMPAEGSSTSPNAAHPTTTRMVERNESGVGESAAVRNAEAPGVMGKKGGSEGGLGLMDRSGTKGSNELKERNPPPIQDVGEKFGKLGVDNAWKQRN